MNYKSLTQSEKNSLAKQYEPLVNKITKQFVERVKVSWDDVKSMAWEGFALAIERYNQSCPLLLAASLQVPRMDPYYITPY